MQAPEDDAARAPCFVGVDGGGTRSTALVVAADGTALARADGGPALVQTGDAQPAVAALADLVAHALHRAGRAAPAAGLCCALAGAGREPARSDVEAGLRAARIARRVHVTTDADAALHDAFGDGAGLLLIAGTGSIGWGRGPGGALRRVGGWGRQLGDEGSGYAIAVAALRAVLRAHDGRAPASGLAPVLLDAAGVDSPPDLIAWAAAAGKGGVAALAPAVATAARAGDAEAAAVIDAAAAELTLHVRALLAATGPWPGPAPLALAGGLIAPGAPLRDVCERALTAAGAPVHILPATIDPARGAATLARSGGAT
jgi:N-acetylglucosamine kinase-like BadF-type ATPase